MLHGDSFHVLRGPVVVPVVLAVAAITAASFFLNAVFAFAIAEPGPPMIAPAFTRARSSLAVILGWGAAVGVCLGVSTVVLARWGQWWFAISLSVLIAVMMVCYVAVPARLIGVQTTHSKRDKLTLTAVGGAVGAVVCTPPYVLGRIGLLMLSSRVLFIPGIIVMAIGVTLEAGTTSAVKAVKMSAKLLPGHQQAAGDQALPSDSRLYSPDSRRGSGTTHKGHSSAPAIQPSVVARIWHWHRPNRKQTTWRPASSHIPCAAPGPHMARWRRQGARGCAAAHPRAWAAQRTSGPGTGLTPSARRAEPTRGACGQRTRRPSRQARPLEWTGSPGRPAPLDHLQMRQQSRAEIALQEDQAVTRRQQSQDRWRGDLRR